MALKKHPDKQPNNPNAAAEFHPIQRAFDLLSDAQARAALDDLYKYVNLACFLLTKRKCSNSLYILAAQQHVKHSQYKMLLDGCCFLCRAKAARKAREAGQSEKRRKMREDLEKRENTWQTARNDEQKARNKLKVLCCSKC